SPVEGRGSFLFRWSFSLLEAGRDRAELGVQRGGGVIDDGDDCQRHAGSDQAVFNSGGAGFILHEASNEVLHRLLQRVHKATTSLVGPAFQRRVTMEPT